MSECSACKAPFTFVRRRHHCRNCGKVRVAATCNNRNVVTSPQPISSRDVILSFADLLRQVLAQQCTSASVWNQQTGSRLQQVLHVPRDAVWRSDCSVDVDPGALRRALVGWARRRLHLSVVPTRAHGPRDPADPSALRSAIASDTVEVTVRYRLP